MDENNQFLNKIVRYLDDPGNAELENEVQAFRNRSIDNDNYFREIKELWDASSEARALEHIRAEGSVERLTDRLSISRKISTPRRTWLRNVAAVILLTAIGYGVHSYFGRVNYVTASTAAATDSILLGDGSKIYMGPNTSVRYPEKQTGNRREVFLLEGEAFFQVSRDASRPFTIAIDSLKVTVLGTSFNIKSGPARLDLAVRSGSVMFESKDARDKAILGAGEGIVYDRSSSVVRQYKDAGGSSFAWVTGELVFRDAPLPEVFASLEKYYNVTFKVEDSLSSFNKFNATFKGSELSEVLNILRETYPLTIDQNGKLVIIKSHIHSKHN